MLRRVMTNNDDKNINNVRIETVPTNNNRRIINNDRNGHINPKIDSKFQSSF